jgi:hypothetical protein
LFGIATGCLGWPPSEAWSVAVPEILLAWDAKVEFLRSTNPFGSGGKTPGPPAPPENETQDEKRERIRAQMNARKVRSHG